MSDPKPIPLNLSRQRVALVLAALAKLPFEQVYAVINDIQQQVHAVTDTQDE